MKKPPQRKPKRPKHKVRRQLVQHPSDIDLDNAFDAIKAIITARKQMMPPDIRAEFERLYKLLDGSATLEESNWFDEVLATYRPSPEAVHRCLMESRVEGGNGQTGMGLKSQSQLGSKPGEQGRQMASRHTPQSQYRALELTLTAEAQVRAAREMMPPADRAMCDRFDTFANLELTSEDFAWFDAAVEKYRPSKAAVERHRTRLFRMCEMEPLKPDMQSEALSTSEL